MIEEFKSLLDGFGVSYECKEGVIEVDFWKNNFAFLNTKEFKDFDEKSKNSLYHSGIFNTQQDPTAAIWVIKEKK